MALQQKQSNYDFVIKNLLAGGTLSFSNQHHPEIINYHRLPLLDRLKHTCGMLCIDVI